MTVLLRLGRKLYPTSKSIAVAGQSVTLTYTDFLNLLVDSSDLTTGNWTATNATTTTTNVTDTNGGDYGSLSQTITTVQYRGYKVWARILKHSDTYYSGFRIEANDDMTFNANGGSVGRLGHNFVTEPTMTDDGTHWIFEGYFIAQDTSTTFTVYPALGTGSAATPSHSGTPTGGLTFSYLRVIEDPTTHNQQFGNPGTWTQSNTCIGRHNRIEDIDGNFCYVSRAFATTNGVDYTITARMKKSTGAKGGYIIGGSVYGFNVDTGQVSGSGMSSTDDGTHWIFTLVKTATGASTTVEIYPALSASWPLSNDGLVTGYIEIDDFSLV